MAVDQSSHSSHRGGRLLDAIRRVEATLGQPPSGLVPGDNAAAPSMTASPWPAAPAAPIEPVAASPEAIPSVPWARADLPRFKLTLPRWPEIEDLAKMIVGECPELVSAVLACASIDRSAAGSLVAAPLARALAARQGEQVLLVESDVYASLRATGTFYQPKPGLAEILTEQIAWSEAVLPTVIERLAYLPAGLDARAFPIDGDLAEQLFAELKRRFKYIVIDAGPAADALAAGWLDRCDEIYLTVELGRTSPRRARDVARQIVAAGGKIRGAVVLDVTA